MSQAYQDKQVSPGTGGFQEQVISLGIPISHAKAAGDGCCGPPCRRLQGSSPDGIEGEGRGEGEQEEDEECGPGVRTRGVE